MLLSVMQAKYAVRTATLRPSTPTVTCSSLCASDREVLPRSVRRRLSSPNQGSAPRLPPRCRKQRCVSMALVIYLPVLISAGIVRLVPLLRACVQLGLYLGCDVKCFFQAEQENPGQATCLQSGVQTPQTLPSVTLSYGIFVLLHNFSPQE